MNKSTLILIGIATLLLGALVGAAVVKSGDAPAPASSASATTAVVVPPDTGGAPVMRFLGPEDVEVTYDEFGKPLPFSDGENFVEGTRDWRNELVTIELEGDASVEYKALMDQGDSISFRWSVGGGQVYYDMHAHDSAFGEEFFTRYKEGESTSGSGTVIAPYAGEHGWYWLNLEEGPVTITLEVSGFFEKIVEIDLAAE